MNQVQDQEQPRHQKLRQKDGDADSLTLRPKTVENRTRSEVGIMQFYDIGKARRPARRLVGDVCFLPLEDFAMTSLRFEPMHRSRINLDLPPLAIDKHFAGNEISHSHLLEVADITLASHVVPVNSFQKGIVA